ncbi:MAG: FAD-dependent oxidoreductase [Gemmatimonadaceae bacterium]|nr:FAD-dependent oxidoreductase [Gemmatimonadaceae bacterium]
MTRRHLVLAGAGHGQLDLLAALVRKPLAGWDISLVTPQPDFHYSGMLPAVIAGTVSPSAAAIPVAAIARAAGIQVHLAPVTALDASARTLTLSNGASLSFDLLSLDVGSSASGLETPGAREHAFAMRPFDAALGLIARLDMIFRQRARGETIPIAVVGAGAGGVEIALALRARVLSAGFDPAVTIIDAAATDGLPLPGFSAVARKTAHASLTRRNVTVIGGTVTAVTSDAVMVTSQHRASEVPSAATAWVSGPAAHGWLASSGLTCDAAGYPIASAALALSSSDDTASSFGAGDCVALRDAGATPKAGVYAVRMAPVLASNVLAAARGAHSPATFSPQEQYLALLSTSDGSAILRWRAVTVESRWAQLLKTWIDERYLRRYRDLGRQRA